MPIHNTCGTAFQGRLHRQLAWLPVDAHVFRSTAEDHGDNSTHKQNKLKCPIQNLAFCRLFLSTLKAVQFLLNSEANPLGLEVDVFVLCALFSPMIKGVVQEHVDDRHQRSTRALLAK